MTDPLGQSQVLPYLIGLSQKGHRFHLISCEKPERMLRWGDDIKALCITHSIQWHPLPYHQGVPVLSGWRNAHAIQRKAFSLAKKESFDWVHCRSYLAGLVGQKLTKRKGIKFLFDMRGFWADERAESGLWPQEKWLYRLLYRYFKRKEKKLIRDAHHIVVLTAKAKEALKKQHPQPRTPNIELRTSVIPCCADFDHFPLQTPPKKQAAKQALRLPTDALVVSYLGSLGTWYLPKQMMQFFALFAQKHPHAHLLVITQDDRQVIYSLANELQIPFTKILIKSASREAVPHLLMASDLGLMFIQPSFAKTASSPTKMAEYLAMGIPLIANEGVGDVTEQLRATGGGLIVTDPFSIPSLQKAVVQYQQAHFSATSIRQKAATPFSLAKGVAAYDEIYQKI